jgi:hypothetical protein
MADNLQFPDGHTLCDFGVICGDNVNCDFVAYPGTHLDC